MTLYSQHIFSRMLFIFLPFLVISAGCKKNDNESGSEITYTDLNPDIFIGTNGIPEQGQWELDLNNDSKKDFLFFAGVVMPNPGVAIGEVREVYIHDSNSVLGTDPSCAKRLLENGRIIPDTCFVYHDKFIFLYSVAGPYFWEVEPDTCKYLGLSILKDNKRYYGWIELDWNVSLKFIRIRSYAIQKYPDSLICAGQTR